MHLCLVFVFLVLALSTGSNVYIIKHTFFNWAKSAFSAFASVASAWTVVYCATRFLYDPSKIVINTFFLNIGMRFPGRAVTEPIVFGNIWLLLCLAPMLLACSVVHASRKVPALPSKSEKPVAAI